jgi:hypothetical protein
VVGAERRGEVSPISEAYLVVKDVGQTSALRHRTLVDVRFGPKADVGRRSI